jgi:putative ABC transport system permease protein
VAIALLLVAAAAVAGLGGLARYRDVLFAGLRGTVQLLVVSLLIAYGAGHAGPRGAAGDRPAGGG